MAPNDTPPERDRASGATGRQATPLPPALDRTRHALADEVAWARTLTPVERAAAVAAACRTTMLQLALNPNAARLLAQRDPLPASSIVALRWLRRTGTPPAQTDCDA